MVSSITALGRSDLKDWFLQRVSAVILALYVLFLLGFFIGHLPVDYVSWSILFAHWWMKIFTLITVFCLIAHAWVGVWTILTDYVTCGVARATIQIIVVLAFVIYVIWAIRILWG